MYNIKSIILCASAVLFVLAKNLQSPLSQSYNIILGNFNKFTQDFPLNVEHPMVIYEMAGSML